MVKLNSTFTQRKKKIFRNLLFYSLNALFLFVFATISDRAFAQFTITETFRGSTVPQEIVLGNVAALTAQQGIDPPGNGWLRLTPYTNTYSSGYCYINQGFPSNLGVLAEFEFKAWRNGTIPLADGFCVFLFDAAYGPTQGHLNLNQVTLEAHSAMPTVRQIQMGVLSNRV